MTFSFTLIENYGRSKLYESDEKLLCSINKKYAWGTYHAAANGPNTAYADFHVEIRWLSNKDQWFGFALKRHFKGNNCGQRARAWLNYLLNNYPYYVSKTSKKMVKPSDFER